MLPANTPKLPKWPFLVGDAALLGLAWLIGSQSRNPFAGTPLIAIVACVVCGAIAAAVPFLADYARKQDEALDERQRALESLSRTVAASAEQISIAANGLHEIAELAQRNLKSAEQLPAKLQEKLAGVKNQPDSTRDNEREELKKELARLRAADSERLQAAAGQITKAAAELSRLAIAQTEAAARSRIAPATPVVESVTVTDVAAPSATVSSGDDAAPPPKRARKPRVEEPAAAPEAKAETVASPAEEPMPIPAAAIPEVLPVAPGSTPPVPAASAEASPELAPVAAEVPAPRPERKRAPRKPKPEPSPVEAGSANAAEPSLDLSGSSSTDSAPAPDADQAAAPVGERTVSSDGATRLLVTAYIGIGNRLFIRGSGPGLSWDKGLPLQFVSIGKWRWETNDASAPVQFKLYKNDDSECAALGTRTLDPGQQEEVTATF